MSFRNISDSPRQVSVNEERPAKSVHTPVIRDTEQPKRVAPSEVTGENHGISQDKTTCLLDNFRWKVPHSYQPKSLEHKSLAMHTPFYETNPIVLLAVSELIGYTCVDGSRVDRSGWARSATDDAFAR
jgi:hypothetical protein